MVMDITRFFFSFSFGRGEYFIEMIYYLSLINRINIWHQAGTLAGHIPQARQRSLLHGTYTSIIEMLFLLHLHVGVMLSPKNAYLEHLPTPPPLLWPFTKKGVLKQKYMKGLATLQSLESNTYKIFSIWRTY